MNTSETNVSIRGETYSNFLLSSLSQVHLMDEFDILQIVGEGWFGKILLVEHKATDTEMVLKGTSLKTCAILFGRKLSKIIYFSWCNLNKDELILSYFQPCQSHMFLFRISIENFIMDYAWVSIKILFRHLMLLLKHLDFMSSLRNMRH